MQEVAQHNTGFFQTQWVGQQKHLFLRGTQLQPVAVQASKLDNQAMMQQHLQLSAIANKGQWRFNYIHGILIIFMAF